MTTSFSILFYNRNFSCDPRKAVDDWIADGSLRTAVVAQYGEIENWIMADVTNMDFLFHGKTTFNADLSNWITR